MDCDSIDFDLPSVFNYVGVLPSIRDGLRRVFLVLIA